MTTPPLSTSSSTSADCLLPLNYSLTTQRGSQAYSQGATFFLLRVGNEYRLVSVSSWIT